MTLLNLDTARARARDLAKNSADLSWATGLPTDSLDVEAWTYISTAGTSPFEIVEKCNAFAVADQLTDVAALADLLSRLRADAHAVEGALLQEVFVDDRTARSQANRRSIDTCAYRADYKFSNEKDAPNNVDIDALYGLEAETRNQRFAFRSAPGHPWNLLEQLAELRRKYCANLSRLLAKAEAATFVLNGSFGYQAASLFAQLQPSGNPMPAIGDWLRKLSLDLEDHAGRERILTVYKYVAAEAWGPDHSSLRARLQGPGAVDFSVDLSPSILGVKATEKARILAVGLAPAFSYNGVFDTYAQANEGSTFRGELRALRGSISFDATITLEQQEYLRDGRRYTFPPVTESFAGIKGWGAGDGSLNEVVSMRTSRRIANRPLGGLARITIGDTVRWPSAVTGRTGIPFALAHPEVTPHDVIVGIRYAASS